MEGERCNQGGEYQRWKIEGERRVIFNRMRARMNVNVNKYHWNNIQLRKQFPCESCRLSTVREAVMLEGDLAVEFLHFQYCEDH